MAEQILTQKLLKKLVHYDPMIGIFSRRVSLGGVKVGGVMGCAAGNGYLLARVAGRLYLLHRLAFLYMTGAFPPEQADHINHNRADNVWTNLRLATNAENCRNRSQQENNTSGCTGVYWDKNLKKWYAKIEVSRKQKYLGSFHKKSEAIAARKRASIKYGFHKNHGSPIAQAATI